MSAFDLFPAEAATKLQGGRAVDLNAGAGFFEGAASAPFTGVASSATELARVVNLGMAPIPAAVDRAFGTDTLDWWFKNMMLERTARRVAPNPREVGVAGQILHSLFDVGSQAVAGGAPLVLVSKTVGKSIEGVEQGLDPETAMRKGAIEGGSAALGVSLPIAMPYIVGARIPGLLQQLGYGVAANVPLGIASRGLTNKVLADAGYGEMAEQYKALDESGLMTDLVLGSAFGALGHAITSKGAKLPLIRPADIDAALAKRNAYHLEVDTAPGLARTGETRDAHVDAVLKATDDLIAGRPVDVSAELRATDFQPMPALDAGRADVAAQTREVARPIAEAQAESRAITEAEPAGRLPIEPQRAQKIGALLKEEGVEPTRENVETVHLIDRARQIDKAAVDAIPASLTDAEYMAKVKGIIGDNEKAKAPAANRENAAGVGPRAAQGEAGREGRDQGQAARGAEGQAAAGGEGAGSVEPLTIAHPDMRAELEHMAREAGWAEVGGRLIRVKHSEVAGDETISRTKWIPRAEWWPGRPGKLNEHQTGEAVRKALAGEKLTKREQQAIDYMVEVANERLGEQRAIGADEVAALTEDLRAEQLEPTHDNVVDVDLVTRASQIDEAAVERAAAQYENDDHAFLAAVQRIIDEHETATREEAARGGEARGGAPAQGERPAPELETKTDAGLRAKEAQASTGDADLKALADAELRGADEIVRDAPDMLVPTEDGSLVPAEALMVKMDEGIAAAEANAKGFEAAVRCATRAGG